jgi:hypothetical protein
MRRVVVAVGAIAALAVPVAAGAHPTRTDRHNAAKECKTERDRIGGEAFASTYGTNENKKNAFGKCVSRRARDEESEREHAVHNAAQECKAERADDPEAFANKYGTNENNKNAFGKCVSGKAKQNEAEADQRDRRLFRAEHKAAKKCEAEREDIGRQAFAEKYARHRDKRRALGRCVSKLARS